MLHGHAQIHQAVILVLDKGSGLRLQIHLLLDHGNHDRNLNGKLVHAQANSGFRQFGKLRPVIYDDEFPRLRIACRRRKTGRLETFENMLPCHWLGSISSVTLSFLN